MYSLPLMIIIGSFYTNRKHMPIASCFALDHSSTGLTPKESVRKLKFDFQWLSSICPFSEKSKSISRLQLGIKDIITCKFTKWNYGGHVRFGTMWILCVINFPLSALPQPFLWCLEFSGKRVWPNPPSIIGNKPHIQSYTISSDIRTVRVLSWTFPLV